MAIQGKTDIDQLLAKSLKEIAVRRPVEKITIKEITDKAGVIRPTFYNHFQDKFELIEWIIRTELLEPVEPLIRNDMIIEAMVLLFTNIEKDKAFYSQLVKMEGSAQRLRAVYVRFLRCDQTLQLCHIMHRLKGKGFCLKV